MNPLCKREARILLPGLLSLLLMATLPAIAETDATPQDQPGEDTAPAETAVAASDTAEAEIAESDAEKENREWIRGRFETGFDGAWDDSGSDMELYQILRIGIEPPQKPNLKLHSSVWLTEDLDGDEARYSPLYSIDDGYHGDVRTRLLDLYLQADDVLGGAVMRLGRQRILDGPLYNRIDGIRLRWDKRRWDAYVYAGTRASLYEDDFKDWLFGAGAGFRIAESTRIGIDLFRAEEDRATGDTVRPGILARIFDRAYPRKVETRVEDQTLGLSLYHRFSQNHWFNAQLLLQDDGAHEYNMDFSGLVARWDLTYLVNYRRQFDRVNDRSGELTGYYRVLGALEQYQHVHVGLERPLTKALSLGIEADIHDSNGGDFPGTNRDYVRLATVLSAKDIGKGVGFSVSLDHWNTSGRDGSWTVTGEIGRKWKAFDWAVGADYEQYRYEYVEYNPWPRWLKTAFVLAVPGVYPGFSPIVHLTDTRDVVAREEIHSLFTRFAWQVKENQRLTTRVAYEVDDSPYAPYWRIRAAYEIQF